MIPRCRMSRSAKRCDRCGILPHLGQKRRALFATHGLPTRPSGPYRIHQGTAPQPLRRKIRGDRASRLGRVDIKGEEKKKAKKRRGVVQGKEEIDTIERTPSISAEAVRFSIVFPIDGGSDPALSHDPRPHGVGGAREMCLDGALISLLRWPGPG